MRHSAADSNIIEIALEETFLTRPVNTQIFQPFVVARLMEHPARVGNTLDYQIIMQNVGSQGTRTATVRWTWTDDMIPPTPLGAQPEDITEAASYPLAFAVIPPFTNAVVDSLAKRGERFDYVLAENGVQCGLEISGTQTADRQQMRDRQVQKIHQLLANPRRWGGYVVIVGFARREIWLSRHEQGER